MRQDLLRDWEMVEELAPTIAGERGTRSLACFVASASRQGWALHLPWPLRDRAFFEDRFVLWPLQQVLDQSDRYAICLTDKDDARCSFSSWSRSRKCRHLRHDPGPDPLPRPHPRAGVHAQARRGVPHHFERVAEAALRLFQREPFQHLIIGGLWETLPQFEVHLHRYLRDRVVARWDIDVMHTPARRFGAGPTGGTATPAAPGEGYLADHPGLSAAAGGARARGDVLRTVAAAGARCCWRSRTWCDRVSAARPAAG